MNESNDNMKNTMPLPQAISVVTITTLGCVIAAWLLSGLVSISVGGMRTTLGEGAALPMFTDMLASNCMAIWWIPILAICVGAPLIVRGNHTTANLIVYVTLFGFLALVSTIFTVVAMVLPWVPMKMAIGS